ncbi:MAG TPA: hypothetical protein DIS74_07425 [Bacteroidales bacterium]|nr:hypothetical protein [Bacteroidales bacterium]
MGGWNGTVGKTMGLDIIKIEPTRVTPQVLFLEGHLEIRGRSISENSTDFFRPLEDWVAAYVEQTEVRTRVVLAFDFINTASTKWVYAIVKRLAQYRNVHEMVSIEWYYEKGDEDQYELGQIIHSFIDCPFIFYETEQT